MMDIVYGYSFSKRSKEKQFFRVAAEFLQSLYYKYYGNDIYKDVIAKRFLPVLKTNLDRYTLNTGELVELLDLLVEKDVFVSFLREGVFGNICEDSYRILELNNLANILNFYRRERAFFYEILKSRRNQGVFLAMISAFYNKYGVFEWGLLKNIYYNLKPRYGREVTFEVISFLIVSNYFEIAKEHNDVFENVSKNDECVDKYLYVLFTPYPSRDDPKIIEYILRNQLPPGASSLSEVLEKLMSKSVGELETHNFTKKDKIEYWLNKFDSVTFVADIAITVASGGIGGVALNLMKKGVIKSVGKIALKRFLKMSYKKINRIGSVSVKFFNRKIERVVDEANKINDGTVAGRYVFSLVSKSRSDLKTICNKGE